MRWGMEILILCGIYLVELLCYQLGLRILFEVRQKSKAKLWMAVGILLPVVIGYLPVEASGKNVLVTVSVMEVTFLVIEGKRLEKMVKTAFVLIFVSLFDDITIELLKNIFSYTKMFSVEDNESYLIMKILSIVCMAGIYILKKTNRFRTKVRIGTYIYFIIGAIVLSMMFCLAVLEYAKAYIQNSRYIILCDIMYVAVHISIFLMVVFIVYIKSTNERMGQLLKSEKLLKEMQVNHYKQLLRKEENTRKYRHDMKNHLLYLQTLLTKDWIEESKTYLNQMQGMVDNVQQVYYVTGNDMVDTIMNYYLGMLPEDADVLISGKIPIQFDIEEIDVCTIFSNLFQNVVEEICGHDLEEAKVEIYINKGREYVQYEIRNTTYIRENIKRNEKNKLPLTSKLDKENHGMGMENVKMTVQRNRGMFSWSHVENVFCVKVVLPIKMTV